LKNVILSVINKKKDNFLFILGIYRYLIIDYLPILWYNFPIYLGRLNCGNG
jgi:hypothetical protein